MCSKSFGGVRFDLGSLLQSRMWYFIPMMDYISPIIGHKGFRCEDNLQEIMCPESFGGVRFDIILCMSRFNHVPSWDTLRRDAISRYWFERFGMVNQPIGNHWLGIFWCGQI